MEYMWDILGVFTGYSYVSGMCRVCVGYVSGMYRVCVETYWVQKRFSEMVLTTELHGTGEDLCLLALTRRNLINLILRGTHTSRFSEINCITLSLAALARYLNYRSFRVNLCSSVVGNHLPCPHNHSSFSNQSGHYLTKCSEKCPVLARKWAFFDKKVQKIPGFSCVFQKNALTLQRFFKMLYYETDRSKA